MGLKLLVFRLGFGLPPSRHPSPKYLFRVFRVFKGQGGLGGRLFRDSGLGGELEVLGRASRVFFRC